MTNRNYIAALKYLDSLNVFGIKPGLKRVTAILNKLNNPQNNYRTVHVTGTNGKGSVCAMLAEILKLDGRNVGLFTSPHLESYCERIRINGTNISEDDFAEMIFCIKNCNVVATQFEVLTAAAFEYFSRRKVDIAVIEVGLGGTYDSTNVITPEVSVITNVALEHENILGDLKGIAQNKAGIIKPNIPVVTGATDIPLQIIREAAVKNNSPLYVVDAPANVKVNLRGEFQKFNAAITIQAANLLDINHDTITAGLTNVEWAGRFEVIDNKFVIDGAHNPHGARALRNSLDNEFPDGRRVWLFGVLSDKHFDEMIDILFRSDDLVIVTAPNSERSAPIEDLCIRLKFNGIECIGVENVNDAVKMFVDVDGDIKIAAGSLYLIGEVRALINGGCVNVLGVSGESN